MTTKGKISPEELERFYESSKLAGVKPGWLGRGSQAPPPPRPSRSSGGGLRSGRWFTLAER